MILCFGNPQCGRVYDAEGLISFYSGIQCKVEIDNPKGVIEG